MLSVYSYPWPELSVHSPTRIQTPDGSANVWSALNSVIPALLRLPLSAHSYALQASSLPLTGVFPSQTGSQAPEDNLSWSAIHSQSVLSLALYSLVPQGSSHESPEDIFTSSFGGVHLQVLSVSLVKWVAHSSTHASVTSPLGCS